jgi:ribosomal protein L7Ae-like RNA K-turn-binding protein
VLTVTAENRSNAPTVEGRDGSEASRTRTCVGCGVAVASSSVRRADGRTSRGAEAPEARPVVRLLLGPGGAIAVDTGARRSTAHFGRGAYVHAETRCLTGAVQRGLPRAAKSAVMLDGAPITVPALAAEIARAYERRARSLLATAKRARKLECGSAAVAAAIQDRSASLVVVATDAAAAADLSEVRRSIAEGRAVAWGTKRELADSVGGGWAEGLGVVAVTDSRLSAALLESRRVVESLGSIEAQDASILAGGAANLRGPSEPKARSGSSGYRPPRSRDGSRRRGVKNA